MTTSVPPDTERPTPRLYLVTPPATELGGLTDSLARMLEAADVAAVLLRFGADERARCVHLAASVAGVTQSRGVALLIGGDPAIALDSGADGVHVSAIDTLDAAVRALKPAGIVGCGGLASRHDAMLAAEGGGDYVMFGDGFDGRRAPIATVIDRVAWWAEVFEMPCVAYAAARAEVAPLAQAGADFVALGDWVWSDPQGAQVAVAEAARSLAQVLPA